MKNLVCFVLSSLFCLGGSFAQGQLADSIYLKRYYLGFLYSGVGESYYNIENVFSVRLGTEVEVPLGVCAFRTKVLIEPSDSSNKLKADGRFIIPVAGWFTISAGGISTLTRELHTPHPITSGSHFLSKAKGIISPGTKPGIRLNTKNVYLGAYCDDKDSFQYHLGYVLEDIGPVKALKASLFIIDGHNFGRKLAGGALTIDLSRLSLTAYSEKARVGQISSLYMKVNLTEKFFTYSSLVRERQNGWQAVEIGFLASHKQKTGPVMVHYVYGLGCSQYPFQAVKFYIQVWLD